MTISLIPAAARLLLPISVSLISFLAFLPGTAFADLSALKGNLERIVPKSRETSVVVSNAVTGARIFALNANVPLKPASVLKILTAMAALEELGPRHQFETRVYGAGLKGSRVQSLFVQGTGDPSLTYETLSNLAKELYVRGIRSIGRLVLDDSLFVGGAARQGERAYQAGNAALALNFNTLEFEVCAGSGKARVMVDPPEFQVELIGQISTYQSRSSLYHITEESSRDFSGWQSLSQPLMRFRLSGNIRKQDGCAVFYRTVAHPTEYFAQVLAGMLHQKGIVIDSAPRPGAVPPGAALIYTQKSKPLAEIVRDMNQFSSNFIAEQLLMALGKSSDGKYYRGEGLAVLTRYAQQLSKGADGIQIRDASGLSHQNKIPAEVIVNLLLRVQQTEEYRVEFERSLAVDSHSGTLRKRSYDGVVRAKTGTINGVTGLAGHTRSRKGHPFAFVIIQNGVSSRAKASKLEKSVLKILHDASV